MLFATRFFSSLASKNQTLTWMPAGVKRLLWGRRVLLLHRVAVRRGLEVKVGPTAAAAATTRATSAAASASAVAAAPSASSLEIAPAAAPSAARFLTRSSLWRIVSGVGVSATHQRA